MRLASRVEIACLALAPPVPEMTVGPRRVVGSGGSTPEWAIVVRLGSLRSNARFTQRSSTDLFQVGSCCAATSRKRARQLVAGDDRGVGRLVVSRPERDRRMVSELLDRHLSLRNCSVTSVARMDPLEREVLKDQQTEFVGAVVEDAVD